MLLLITFRQQGTTSPRKCAVLSPLVECEYCCYPLILIELFVHCLVVSSFRINCCWACLILYAFFCVISRRLEFICQRFGTVCLFHLHRQLDVSRMNLGYPIIITKPTNALIVCNLFLNHFFKTLSLLLHISIAYRFSSSGSTYSS